MFFRFQLNLQGNTPYDQNGDLSKDMFCFLDEDLDNFEVAARTRNLSPRYLQDGARGIEGEIIRRMDKYEIMVVPDVHTLLWGIFSIFPILLPFTFSGAALVAACK